MPPFGTLVIPITLAVAAAGILIVLTPFVLRKANLKGAAGKTLEMMCTVCQQNLVISLGGMETITGSEMALVVRECSAAEGQRLAGYRCPYCEAYHVFATDAVPPKWLVANPFEPQRASNHCSECRQPLLRPPWPQGQFDGRIAEAEGMLPKHGLVCPRCGSVCCLECCERTGRGRAEELSLMCPRCHRGPVDKIHHF